MRSVTRMAAAAASLLAASGCASTQKSATESPNPTTREVASAQQQSEEALKRAQGRQLAAGVVTQVRPDEIVVQPPSGDAMHFRLNSRTQVDVAGTQGTADQIREGADARVAYENSATGPTAVSVSVSP